MYAKHKRLVTISLSIIIMVVGAWIILHNFRNNIVFFFYPHELATKDIKPNQLIRIGGIVKQDSLKVNGFDIKFVITDHKVDINVTYKGHVPMLFKEKQGTVVKGYLHNNHFEALEVLAKHDENYAPKEIQNIRQKQ